MWKKKHATGSVIVYDEDNDSRRAGDGGGGRGSGGRRHRDEFADLGLGDGPPRAYGGDSRQSLEQMTAAELEAEALAAARAGHQGTTRALAMAVETREIGVHTAHTMQQQTEQLERMGDEIEVVHDYLDKSDRIIDKMTKPKIVRMFRGPKKNGKGLDKVRGSKKDHAEREHLKARGLGTLDLDAMQQSGNHHADPASHGAAAADASAASRDELLQVRDVGKKGKRDKASSSASALSNSRNVHEDYSQYSTGVATALREQDQDLDQISDALSDMKALADGMNAELTYQGKLIDEIQDFTEETSRRTKDHARRVNQIK